MAKEGLQFEFSASTAEYRKAVESMPKDLQKAADEIEEIGKEINASMGNAIGRGLVQGLAGAGVALKLREVISQFDQVSDAAKRFGTSAEDIQRVDFAAKAAGSSMETVASAMESAGVRANKAAREGGELADAFNRAGIDAVAFSMGNLSERIEMVGRAQNGAAGDAQQLANITEALGQSVAGVDFSSMSEGMRDVNVLSNETVRQISEANGEIVKFERNITLAIGAVLGGLADVGERIGSIIAQEGALGSLQRALLALTPAAPLSLIGGQTIEEMEQAEEALNGLPPLFEKAAQSADVAAESAVNYSQVLKQLVEVNAEMEASMARMEKGAGALGAQLAEAELRLSQLSQEFAQSGDADVFKEIQKTAKEILSLRQQTAREEEKIRSETAKTSEEYRKQADAQARSIVSIDEEIQMLEAKLSGNEALSEELQRQQDFRKAFEATGSAEQADKLAGLLAQERQMEGGGRGGSGGSTTRTDRPLTQDQRVAQMRAAAAAERTMGRAGEFQAGGMFNSAVNRQMASERAEALVMDRQANRDLAAQFDFAGREAGNLGEAMKSVIDEVGKMGEGGFLDRMRGAEGFDPKAGDEQNFLTGLKEGVFDDLRDFDPDNEMKRFTDDAAKTEAERKREEESMRDKSKGPTGQQDQQDPAQQIYNWLENTFFGEFKKRLPQVALG
jgi:hypothetical protein